MTDRTSTGLRVEGLDGVIAVLQSLPAEVVSKKGGPVKLALAKGARMLRDAARLKMAEAIAQNGSDSTGTTLASLVATRGRIGGGLKGEKYLLRVKKRDFINARGIKTSTLMTANLLEYGSKHQPATPWLRPVAQENAQRIVTTVNADMVRRVDLLVNKLARQNGVPK